MTRFTTLIVSAACAATTLFAATALAAEKSAPVQVSGEKLDSGLGELPHYRDWSDKTGKNVVAKQIKQAKQVETAPVERADVKVSKAE
jgi:hypothetical protein